MGTTWRIRDRSTFAELRRRGRRVRSGALTLTWIPGSGVDPPRVAYAVGKAVGKAVVRNRVRRRLRGAVTELGPRLPAGAYLIGASPAAASSSPQALRADLVTLVAGLPRPAGAPPATAGGRVAGEAGPG